MSLVAAENLKRDKKFLVYSNTLKAECVKSDAIICCLVLMTLDPGDNRGTPELFFVERYDQRQIVHVV